MKILTTCLWLFLLLPNLMQSQEAGIGQWSDYTSYHTGNKVVDAGDFVYYSTNRFLAKFDKEYNRIQRLNTITGLSDIGISTIGYNFATQTLVIGYANANIDLLVNNKIINIPDIRRKEIQGKKKINHIMIKDQYAYLSCGFGIVVVDVKRQEIKETYYLGENSSPIDVYSLSENDTSFVAFTEKGIMYADKKNPILNNSDNWHLYTKITEDINNIAFFTIFNNEFVYVKRTDRTRDHNDSIFVHNGTTTTLLDTIFSIQNLESNNQYLLVSMFPDLVVFDKQFKKSQILPWSGPASAASDVKNNHVFWTASRYGGLVYGNPTSNEQNAALPESPLTSDVFDIFSWENITYVAPGSRGLQFQSLAYPANIYKYKDHSWTAATDKARLDTIWDIVSVIVDPNNSDIVYAGSWFHGLLETKDFAHFSVYNETNSNGKLQPIYINGIRYSLRVGGMGFDSKGNLWMANNGIAKPLVVKRTNNTWDNYDLDGLVTTTEYKLTIDYEDNIWMINKDNRLVVGKPPYYAAWVNINKSPNQDNQSSQIFCLTEDFDGALWIGTDKGIKVIFSKEGLYDVNPVTKESPVIPQNIVYTENGQTQFLLKFESVTCIAIDGANRKWVGTAKSGVYLLSSDGLTQLQHFTVDNSPLPSNNILALSIDQRSGEVFIGTDIGLISYRGTATFGYDENEKDRVYAFPNPVRPEYNGPIAVKGLAWDVQVKIADASGNVVYSGIANGGQVVWNGLQSNGKRIKSGVYFVFVTNEDGKDTLTTKFVVVR